MISKIKEFIFSECQKKENLFDKSFFEEHILVVEKFSLELAKYFKADEEIVRLSSFLHDISAIQNFSSIPEHNKLGAEIAAKYLKELNYPEEKIQLIAKCIIAHKSPVGLNNGTPEEICISNADAMAQINNILYWSFYTFNVHKFNFNEGKNILINRMENNWNNLITPAKDIIEKKYLENIKILKNS
jgi:uncharacterized protein